jgi:hypothetical protein
MRQAQRAPGFLGGWLGGEGGGGYWTSTVWENEQSMRAFRNNAAHLTAMPKLLRWCDETAWVHWEQPDATPLPADVAYDRLARDGKLGKVLKASARHAAGKTVSERRPRVFNRLTPA